MPQAWIALGSNLSDPPAQLGAALKHLQKIPGLEVQRCSRFYRSAPLGPPGQADYCNAVCGVRTDLPPDGLLKRLQTIEDHMGRDRSVPRWGSRVIDLDLLVYGDVVLDTPELKLPHPELQRRAFVLVPLADLAPDLLIPGRGKVSALLESADRAGVGSWES